jgi:chromosome partitioning protein
VIDCPPSLGVLTETAIVAADFSIIPCLMEARGADGLVDLLEAVSIFKGEEFDAWRILLTKVDSRKMTINQAVTDVLTPWKNKIFATTIPQSEPLNQAQIEPTDIFSFEPHSKGALAYEALTKEILRYGR